MFDFAQALPAAIAFFATLIIAWAIMPFVIRYANKRQLFDIPDGRKLHDDNISRIGGISIMFSVIISISLFVNTEALSNFGFLVAGMVIIFFVGLLDDMYPIKPAQKLIGEFIPALLLAIPGRDTFSNLNGLMGINILPEWISFLLTFILIIAIINSFNLIDGINGLAGICGVLAALILGSTSLIYGMIDIAIIAFTLAGGIVAFLRFNLIKPRIFMGDSGSLLIGYITAFLFLSVTGLQGSASHSEIWQDFLILIDDKLLLLSLSAVIVPLTDLSRVFIIRISKGKSPFSADRNHIHHLLLEAGCSHFAASLMLGAFTILNFITFFFCLHLDINTQFILLLIMAVLLSTIPHLILSFIRKQSESKEVTY
jgi:UDP-N-acetylmuramyl pentapeptide phosphotransferase/UDP-N-acetylglucosamine-1-phosphate transferase